MHSRTESNHTSQGHISLISVLYRWKRNIPNCRERFISFHQSVYFLPVFIIYTQNWFWWNFNYFLKYQKSQMQLVGYEYWSKSLSESIIFLCYQIFSQGFLGLEKAGCYWQNSIRIWRSRSEKCGNEEMTMLDWWWWPSTSAERIIRSLLLQEARGGSSPPSHVIITNLRSHQTTNPHLPNLHK